MEINVRDRYEERWYLADNNATADDDEPEPGLLLLSLQADARWPERHLGEIYTLEGRQHLLVEIDDQRSDDPRESSYINFTVVRHDPTRDWMTEFFAAQGDIRELNDLIGNDGHKILELESRYASLGAAHAEVRADRERLNVDLMDLRDRMARSEKILVAKDKEIAKLHQLLSVYTHTVRERRIRIRIANAPTGDAHE